MPQHDVVESEIFPVADDVLIQLHGQRLNVADALKQLLVATGAAKSAEDFPANAKISFLLKALLEHYGGDSGETSDRVSEIISVLAKAIEENGGVSEPEGSITIVENGTHDVKDYASAEVNVPNPSSGSITITENGTYDVKDYASAEVNVESAAPEWKYSASIKNAAGRKITIGFEHQNGTYHEVGVSDGNTYQIPVTENYVSPNYCTFLIMANVDPSTASNFKAALENSAHGAVQFGTYGSKMLIWCNIKKTDIATAVIDIQSAT